MKLTTWFQVRWQQKDSHGEEVGQTTGGHVSESNLLLANRQPRGVPIGPVSANEGITNRKSVPPGQGKDDLHPESCQNLMYYF